jgi:hypothetical protein
MKENALGAAVRRVLRPLVRILLRNGVPARAFIEHVKKVYVDVALNEFSLSDRKPSLSHASVITGLTRKEVSRLVELDEESDEGDVKNFNRAARVIRGWVRDRKFRDGRGQPASLPFEGSARSFSEVVRRHSGDMPARAVLDELLRVGAVRELRDGRIQLLSRAYVPHSSESEVLGILGRDVGALISTIDHNLMSPPEEAFFQLKVSYDNLPSESLEKMRSSSRRGAMALLEQLDKSWSKHDRDVNPAVEGTGRKQAMLGIYYFEDDSDVDET